MTQINTEIVGVVIAFLAACLAIAVIFSGLPSTVNAACGELIGGKFVEPCEIK